jgi:hypothetical protein
MRDIVQVHISSAMPIQSRVLGFANRVEVRLGKAFPVALIVDRDAVDSLMEAIGAGRAKLLGSGEPDTEEGSTGDDW